MRAPIVGLALLWASGGVAPASSGQGVDEGRPARVVKTDKEWAQILTRPQFLVCRMKATEPAFSGKYLHNHAPGLYLCVCCGADLFSSRAKFESGTGWPSFFSPVRADRIARAPDYHSGEPRIEVTCATCGAHLGHVFNDGPPPTGLRFCLNSVALRFVNAKDLPRSKPASPPAEGGPPASESGAEPPAAADDRATPAEPER